MSSTLLSRGSSDKYWATEDVDECTLLCWAIIKNYRKAVKSSTLYPRWVRGFRTFHGLPDNVSGDASVLSRRGSKGHRAQLRGSRIAVDARHQLGLVAPMIPSLDAIPVNTAYKTLSQVREGKRFFDYYVSRPRNGLGRELYATSENMQKFGIGWVLTDWDPFAGQPLEPPETDEMGTVTRTTAGDVVFYSLNPLTAIVDLNQDGTHDWFIAGIKMSRWELIQRHASQNDEIKTALQNVKTVHDDDKWTGNDFGLEGMQDNAATDLIRVWTLYHRKTRTVPQGRMLRFVDAETWLFDGPLPYEDIPAAEMNAGKIWNTPFGDSTLHHAIGLEQAKDRALSAVVTNVLATGHQIVAIQDENFDLQELSDGVSAICGKPPPGGGPLAEGVSLTASNAEAHSLLGYLDGAIDAVLGTNSVIRGEPDSNIKSGAFAGLLVQQATQYNSPAQYSFQRCVEEVGNHLLVVLKRFADRPIMAEISGPNGQWRLAQFTQEDFSGIHRLIAKPGNPAEQTAVFRKQKADQLLEAGLIKSPQEYETICETNSDELATEDNEAEDLNILRENEMMLALADGKQTEETQGAVPPPPPPQPPPMPGMGGHPMQPAPPPAPTFPDGSPLLVPPVLITDNDSLHVRKHANQLNSPQARGNTRLVTIIGAHLAWHMQNSATKPPELAAMLGQPPPAPPPMLAPPPVASHEAEKKQEQGKPPPGPNGVQGIRPIQVPAEGRPAPRMGP